MEKGPVHSPPLKNPSPDIFLPSPSSPSRSIDDNANFPVSASHCKPPSCSASGPASQGKMAATLRSSLLGLVPSELEIDKAIRALLDLWQSASSTGSEQNWMRLFGCRDSSILMSSGWGRVRHALHLLLTEPAIKRLVISLVSDKAFWSAIMNNQSVQKFQELLLSDDTKSPLIYEEIDWGTNNPRWLLDILKDKIMELIEKFKLLLIETFQHSRPPTPEATAELEDRVGSSLLLSVLIILVVVLARVQPSFQF
ncbi:uncharacterized protein LOC115744380 [Rhodamnia argentea]|uniref:Uncharacterized protein LOC115744380 n=1 Tax=Rhodamnia argentea TaxID=178133 RepID=A0A8B8PKP7_9MYRT|nr:uncharacterized protein LOC115744380 [Rhodamnia argentea]